MGDATGRRPDSELSRVGHAAGTSADDVRSRLDALQKRCRDLECENRALRDDVDHYRRLFHNHPAIMLLIDPATGSIVEANAAACAFYGYHHDELVAMRITDINCLTPDEVARQMHRARSRACRTFHFRHRLAGGHVRDVEVHSGPVEFDDKTLLYSIISDVTERNRAEQSLRQREATFRALMEAVRESLLLIEVDGVVLACNETAAKRLGRTERELIATNVFDLLPEEVRKSRRTQVQRLIETGSSVEFEDCRAGVWFETTLYPVFDDRRRVVQCVIFGRDITDRKQAEKQLWEMNETLERCVVERTAEAENRARQLQRLTAEMAQAEERERRRLAQVLHDHLQQLLVAAMFRLRFAEKRTENVQAREAIAEAFSYVDEAIDESRSLARDLSPRVLYDEGLAAALQWLAGEAQKKYRLPVVVQAVAELEPRNWPTKMFVFQAARELILNAVKHAGASSLTIRLSRNDRTHLQVIVEDDGAGFDPAMLDGEADGKGFGLFSIRERFDAIGGQLAIDSAPGRGTKATLIAPCKRAGKAR